MVPTRLKRRGAPIRPQSSKQKGRRFQQEIVNLLLKVAGIKLEPDDIRSTSMGAPGEDVLFSPAARRLFPFSIECKNVEKLNIWEAIKQAKENMGKHIPVVCFKRNNHEAWIAMPIKDYMRLHYEKENDCNTK